VPGATSYAYYLDNVLKTTKIGPVGILLNGLPVDNRPHRLKVIVQTPCGSISTSGLDGGYIATCNGGGLQRVSNFSDQNTVVEKEPDIANFERITVYPNPASKTISISIPALAPKKASIRLYDLSGKQIRNIIPVSQTTVINIAQLAPGIYIAEIFDGLKSERKKIIKN